MERVKVSCVMDEIDENRSLCKFDKRILIDAAYTDFKRFISGQEECIKM